MDKADSTAILFRARAGVPGALDELYARYGGRLLSLIRIRMGAGLRPRVDSRDILQATLLKSFQHLDQFDGANGASLMAWLTRIAENEIRDQADRQGRQRRDQAREEPLDPVEARIRDHMRSAVSQLIVDEEAARLERAIAGLDEAHREAILLRKFEELSYAEMAARLGRSEDACRMLVARAMVALTLRMRGGRVMGLSLEERFARFVEEFEFRGRQLDPVVLCEDRPDLLWSLRALIDQYLHIVGRLPAIDSSGAPAATALPAPLPSFAGFRTIERIGAGGMGEVYKLQDLTLDRIVAAKVLRADARVQTGLATAIGEARAMALFSDPRIVQVFEFRADAPPPVIIMEYVDGFELGRVAPSLEPRQRARIMKEVCEAIGHAHGLGLQHRDLKPSNIMLDAALNPKILDFGLASGSPGEGHFVGTPPYLAPEQLQPSQPIDERTDIYALGVVLYEMLCGETPYRGASTTDLVQAVKAGQPKLPVEIDPGVPEPLQAIALKAMEREPANRYPSAREMALDLGRFLDGRPVLARPTLYASALAARARPHLEQIREWLRLRLIYPHEAARLAATYSELERREDDWIVAGRVLSYSQIALYLGALFVIGGSLFYFGAHRFHDAVRGVLQPFVVLAVPFVGLNLAAWTLARRDHRAVSVAFYLAGVAMLPLFLLIAFHEAGIWIVPAKAAGQIFTDGSISNRQLQVTILVACAWACGLALHTRTIALTTVFGLLLLLFSLSVLGDFGLRSWVEEGRWDRLALYIAPLVAVYAAGGAAVERPRPWFARPMFIAAALVLICSLELLAQNGKAFEYLHFSLRSFQPGRVEDPLLLDTLAAMSLNGMIFYVSGLALERFGSDAMRPSSLVLFIVSPFAVLEPIGYLTETGQYSLVFDWCYLALALAAAVLSHQRQRRSFYMAGVLNAGVALSIIADHRHWFDKPSWAVSLIVVGLAVLAAGFGLSSRERAAARPGHRS